MTMVTRIACSLNPKVSVGHTAFFVIFSVFVILSTLAPSAVAQVSAEKSQLPQASAKLAGTGIAEKNRASLYVISGPSWKELTPSQQMSLKPLAADWNSLGEARKRKWIALAANYPTLSPEEQAKLHGRMTEWAALSQVQRNQARLNYAESKKLSPSQKTATWKAYQALSPEDKKKLAISAVPKPVGAADAAKPVAPKKLAIVPVTTDTPKQAPKISAAKHAVDRNTLLPRGAQ